MKVKVDKGALSNNALVKAVQSRPSISNCHWSGTVDEVYKHFIEETGAQEASKDEAKQAAAQKESSTTFNQIVGDIFIPILPAIVTAGLLMGINNLLTMKGLFGPKHLLRCIHKLLIFQTSLM